MPADPEELRGLQERVALVDAIVEEPGWAVLWDRMVATIRVKQLRIVQGKCTDHENYLKECAFLDGVEYVRKLPERMKIELEEYTVQLRAATEGEPEEE
jgi:hypothetical protein